MLTQQLNNTNYGGTVSHPYTGSRWMTILYKFKQTVKLILYKMYLFLFRLMYFLTFHRLCTSFIFLPKNSSFSPNIFSFGLSVTQMLPRTPDFLDNG